MASGLQLIVQYVVGVLFTLTAIRDLREHLAQGDRPHATDIILLVLAAVVLGGSITITFIAHITWP